MIQNKFEVKRFYDTRDHQAVVVCLAELSDGRLVEAIEVFGDWETMDGEAIHPVRFAPSHIGIFKAGNVVEHSTVEE